MSPPRRGARVGASSMACSQRSAQRGAAPLGETKIINKNNHDDSDNK